MRVKLVILFCILKTMSCNPVDGNESGDEPRIIGGTPASDGQAPYQCSFQDKDGHFCGCAVISSQWIITAAHCLGPPGLEYMVKVRVGTNNHKSGGQLYDIERMIIHPGFKRGLEVGNAVVINDIGLMRVRGNIQFNDKVQPINYGNAEVPPGTKLLVTGWGRTDHYDPKQAEDLQQITLTSISQQECGKYWELDDGKMCTSSPEGQGMCYGDSGGPLVWGSTLVGLVSYGEACAKGIPDVFTKVSHYTDWIKQTVN